MGRTIPSFRIVLEMEREEWKPFRNALDKKDKKKFDEMWDIPRWYVSACSNSVQYVRLHPILMSILLYDYKELTQCISEVERIEARVNSKKKEWLTVKKKKEEQKEQEKEEVPTTLDSYFIENKYSRRGFTAQKGCTVIVAKRTASSSLNYY
ncbi:MAG: hypothetical protein M3264_08545 [Thermoproteota archaeon]|nr:hypothetical protein [Thermoproteota archaeon]